MNISSVSFYPNNTYLPVNDNDVIKLLEKQKIKLQEQIQKINESNMNPEIKKERIKEIQDQISQIDLSIKQKQAEKLNKVRDSQNKTSVEESTKNSNSNESDSCLPGITDLLQASCTYSQAKLISDVKNSLTRKQRVLEKEIELDESRSHSGSAATSKRNELQKIEHRERILDGKLADTIENVQKHVENSSETEGKKDNKTAANNNKNEVDTVSGTSMDKNPSKTKAGEAIAGSTDENHRNHEATDTYKSINIIV